MQKQASGAMTLARQQPLPRSVKPKQHETGASDANLSNKLVDRVWPRTMT